MLRLAVFVGLVGAIAGAIAMVVAWPAILIWFSLGSAFVVTYGLRDAAVCLWEGAEKIADSIRQRAGKDGPNA